MKCATILSISRMFQKLISTIFILAVVVVAQNNLSETDLDNFMNEMFKELNGTAGTPPVNLPNKPVQVAQNNISETDLDNILIGILNELNGTAGTPLVYSPNKPVVDRAKINPETYVPPPNLTEKELVEIMKTIFSNPTENTPTSTTNGCGYRNTDFDPMSFEARFGEMDESGFGEFPWMVAVLKLQSVGIQEKYLCGGSLIHPKVVLTAAHCTQRHQKHILKVRAGEWDTQTTNEIYPHQDRDIAENIVHPQYYSGGFYNDISLLILSEPFKLEPNVQTICLPPHNTVFDGNRCTVSGWGREDFGSSGANKSVVKFVELPIVPRNLCQNSLRRHRGDDKYDLHESFICAGGEIGINICKGAGGSPLVCPIENTSDRYYQSGVLVWGRGCGENQLPHMYAGVAKFRNWIDQQFSQRGLDSSSYTAFR